MTVGLIVIFSYVMIVCDLSNCGFVSFQVTNNTGTNMDLLTSQIGPYIHRTDPTVTGTQDV